MIRCRAYIVSLLVLSALLGTVLPRPSRGGDDGSEARRQKLLSVGMKLVRLDPPRQSHVTTAAPGLAWFDTILHASQTEISILVVVRAPANAPAWKIRVLDGDRRQVEEIPSTEPCWSTGACWTSQVPNGEARIELWTGGDPSGIQVTLDSYLFATIPSAAQATIGEDDKQDIVVAEPAIRKLAPPVARLVLMNVGAYCTGFLIAPSLLITNQHCITDESDALATIAEFNYQTPRSVPERRYRVRHLEAADANLDYAVVRLDPEAGAKYGRLRVALHPTLQFGMPLALIQHPAGQLKMVAVKNCAICATTIRGAGPAETDFGHTCDTLQGSSGAPVLSTAAGQVIGLHHWNFDEHDQPVNQAVHMALILDDLKNNKKLPLLVDEVLAP